MAARALAGSRIRERRQMLAIKQSALAGNVGISPTYLSLIETNQRRIGGKLLVDIAEALDVDPSVLAEGAEAELVVALRDAAERVTGAEVARLEEFAGRFPGWAGLVASQHRLITTLERRVEALGDRMAHDPELAASLHEVLSTVTSINATSSILVEPGEIEPEWRDRFHRNIHEDSQRLAEGSQALVSYLERGTGQDAGPLSPREALEHWLTERSYHIEELDRSLPLEPDTVLERSPLAGGAAAELARSYLDIYASDAAKMPLAAFQEAVDAEGMDIAALAGRFGVDLASVMRRLVCLPGGDAVGLVRCDAAGSLVFRRAIDGFAMPRFGAACPLWPLYRALSHPMQPVRGLVEMAGRDPMRFLVFAIAQPVGEVGFDIPPVFEATMLILPAPRDLDWPVQQVGSSCRICAVNACDLRREPSILAG